MAARIWTTHDPHVEKLYYDLCVDSETLEFKDPAPISGSEEDFDWTLSEGLLESEIKTHYATILESRQPVDAFLDAYVIYHELHNQGGFAFRYRKANIIDRDPAPVEPGPVRVSTATATGSGVSGGSIRATIIRQAYPNPPEEFCVDLDVRSVWDRYQMYLKGQDQLTNMSHFCLTALERPTGVEGRSPSRREGERLYSIAFAVLNKLGDISSDVGTDKTARKAQRKYDRPHTPEEWSFMEEIVKQMIERMAYRAATGCAPDPVLTLDDLPGGTGLLA